MNFLNIVKFVEKLESLLSPYWQKLSVRDWQKEANAIAPGISYVAAATKNACHNTFGLNLNNSDDCEIAIRESIEDNDIDALLLGALSSDYKDVKYLISIIRNVKPELLIILGGYIVTAHPILIVENLDVNFGITGAGEEPTVMLLNRLENKITDYSGIPGLVYRNDEGEVVRNESNVDRVVDMTLIPDLPLLFDENIRKTRQVPIIASSGCPFKCTFCSRFENGNIYTERYLRIS